MKERGFTILEVTLVAVVIAIVSVLACGMYLNALTDQRGRTCSANLRTIEAAKTAWVHDHPGQDITSTNDLLPYLKTGVLPTCPSGGTYGNLTDRTHLATCSLYEPAKPWAHAVNP
ncbi:MAG: prepilin-type N-terminal cleavage/methylation domain-containing protein [Chthoniobacterales bacterium]